MKLMKYLLPLFLALSASTQIVPVDTAIVVTVGPLIDAGDFVSLETAIAYNATGMSVDLIESSGTASTKTDLTLTTGSTQDWTHLGNGIYEIEITAAQNDTEGNLQIVGVATGVLPFFSPVYTVVPVLVFNSLNLGSDNLQVDTLQIEGTDATSQINAEADTALADYDPPTDTEMNARTLAAASYFDPAADTVANVTTVSTLTGHTAQTADHTASIVAILADTAAVDTASELRTLLMGSNVAPASTTQAATVQADLDILAGTDGVTLATSQPNYAPYTGTPPTVGAIRTEMETAGGHLALILEDTGTTLPATLATLATATALSTHDGKLDTVDDFLDTEIAAILGDTNELQTRLSDMIEADGVNWRYTTNSLENAPSAGGGGGDATATNQIDMIDKLKGLMSKSHTLVTAVGTFDPATDSVEAIRENMTGTGSGDTVVTKDTLDDSGGSLYATTTGGAGIPGVTVRAYVRSEYDAGVRSVKAVTSTGDDGGFIQDIWLNTGTEYALEYQRSGYPLTVVYVTP